jgi:hypothetical protein
MQAREGSDRGFDIGRTDRPVCDFDKRTIRLGEEVFNRQGSDCGENAPLTRPTYPDLAQATADRRPTAIAR